MAIRLAALQRAIPGAFLSALAVAVLEGVQNFRSFRTLPAPVRWK